MRELLVLQPELQSRKRRRLEGSMDDDYSQSLDSPSYPSVVYTVTSDQSPDTTAYTFFDDEEVKALQLLDTIGPPPLASSAVAPPGLENDDNMFDIVTDTDTDIAEGSAAAFTKGSSERCYPHPEGGKKRVSCVTPSPSPSSSSDRRCTPSHVVSYEHHHDVLNQGPDLNLMVDSRLHSSSQVVENPYQSSYNMQKTSSHGVRYKTTYESSDDNIVHLIDDDESDDDNRQDCYSSSEDGFDRKDAYSLQNKSSAQDRTLDSSDVNLSFRKYKDSDDDDYESSLETDSYTHTCPSLYSSLVPEEHLDEGNGDADADASLANQDQEPPEIHDPPPLPRCHSNDSEFLSEEQMRKHFLDVTSYNATIAEANATLMRQTIESMYDAEDKVDDDNNNEDYEIILDDLALSNLITPPPIGSFDKGINDIDSDPCEEYGYDENNNRYVGIDRDHDALEQQQIIKNVIEPVSREMKQIVMDLQPLHNTYPKEFDFDDTEERWYAQISRNIDDVYYHQPSSGRIIRSTPSEYMDTCDTRRDAEKVIKSKMNTEPCVRSQRHRSHPRQDKWQCVPDDDFVQLVRPERQKQRIHDRGKISPKKRRLAPFLFMLLLMGLMRCIFGSGLSANTLPHCFQSAMILMWKFPMQARDSQSQPPWLRLECLENHNGSRCQRTCAPHW